MEFLTVPVPETATTILAAAIEGFSRENGQPVNQSHVDWDAAWRELVNVGIYRKGPDIAEIGSTWLESLVAMQSLYPFSPQDITRVGGQEIFFPSAWQNVVLPSQKEIYGVPFRADVRVVFYWKDMFETVSIDPTEAFSSTENMQVAFTKLQQAGISPWVAPTNNTHNTVYMIASWLWGAGGDFLSPDGKRTQFGLPAAQRGIQAYFDLLRFMPQQTFPLTDNDVWEIFSERKAAAVVAGPWLVNNFLMKKDGEELISRLGTVLLPGPSFVGGSTLVIWKHGKHWPEAVEFIKRLTSVEFQSEYCQVSGLLPVRQDLWTEHFIGNHEYLSVFNKAMRAGRGLPPIALWGMIEDRLSATFAAIWRELYSLDMSQKSQDKLDKIVTKHLEILAARLDVTLSE